MIKEKLLIVADDYTGANDTGVQFSKRNLRTIVITENEFINKSLKDCDVLVVDTESRSDTKEVAYKKAFEIGKIIKTTNLKWIYKKLDSTFRGNIGAEISGLMDSLDIQHTILVPALPSNARTTINGIVYVKGLLLSETEVADDPKTPVRESFIPNIISCQTDKKIALINYEDVISGKQNLIQKVEQHMKNGIHMIVIDAKEKGDIELIASVITTLKEKVLYAGSSGLAEFLPKYFDIKKEKKSNIIIAGSVSEVTRKQIDYAMEKTAITLIEVEIGQLFTRNIKKEKRRIIEIVKASSLKGEDVIISSASTKAIVTKSFEQGKKYGFDRFKVSESIALFLGEISRIIIQEIEIKGILFTGGDISIKAAKCLNISGTIIKDEILPGIPYGNFVDERYKDIIIVSKAGAFGGEDAIIQVLTFLRNV